MKKTGLIFGTLILSVLLLFNLSKYTLLSGNVNIELILALLAIVFFFIGVFFYSKVKTEPLANRITIDYIKIKELQITDREYDVLKELSQYISNKEIAEHLFLSESTIKTHVSSLLKKLDAKNRIQLTERAREHQLL